MTVNRERRRPPPFLEEEAWENLTTALMLAPREVEVLRLIHEEYEKERIAIYLGISIHTVNTYLFRLYRKLNANSRSNAVIHVLRAYIELAEVGQESGLANQKSV